MSLQEKKRSVACGEVAEEEDERKSEKGYFDLLNNGANNYEKFLIFIEKVQSVRD